MEDDWEKLCALMYMLMKIQKAQTVIAEYRIPVKHGSVMNLVEGIKLEVSMRAESRNSSRDMNPRSGEPAGKPKGDSGKVYACM